MSERERLIKLIDDFGDDVALCDVCNRPPEDCEGCTNEQLAEYLLENGVIVLPCKVGDTVYQTDTAGQIYASTVKNIIYDTSSIAFDERAIGTTVFLTKEQAEKALKGGGE